MKSESPPFGPQLLLSDVRNWVPRKRCRLTRSVLNAYQNWHYGGHGFEWHAIQRPCEIVLKQEFSIWYHKVNVFLVDELSMGGLLGSKTPCFWLPKSNSAPMGAFLVRQMGVCLPGLDNRHYCASMDGRICLLVSMAVDEKVSVQETQPGVM